MQRTQESTANCYELYGYIIFYSIIFSSFWHQHLPWKTLWENTDLWESLFNLMVYLAGYSKWWQNEHELGTFRQSSTRVLSPWTVYDDHGKTLTFAMFALFTVFKCLNLQNRWRVSCKSSRRAQFTIYGWTSIHYIADNDSTKVKVTR